MSSQRPNDQNPQEPERDEGDRVKKAAPRARQGVTVGHMRYVVPISIALALIALAVAAIWVF